LVQLIRSWEELLDFLTAKIIKPGEMLAQEFMNTKDFRAEFNENYK
jgi:hypothetical protein